MRIVLNVLCLLIVAVSCNNRTKTPKEGKHWKDSSSAFDIQKAINSDDIDRTSRPDTAVLNLYQGNGRFGCSYGPMGLHINSEKTQLNQYMHIQHFARAKFGSDYLLLLSHIYWESEPEKLEVHYNQKHPVQLKPLAFLPIGKKVSAPVTTAYQHRYKITEDSYKPHFSGWTLGEFLLAGSRMGDTEG
jgi:hypothetical protein